MKKQKTPELWQLMHPAASIRLHRVTIFDRIRLKRRRRRIDDLAALRGW